MNYQGMLICWERMRRNWSQEGLCKGICGVSYLSKIENGKAEPSEEVLRLLLERLELHTDAALEREAARIAERAYELLFSLRENEFAAWMAAHPAEAYRASAAGLDLLLLESQLPDKGEPLDAALEGCMNARQLSLQRLLQKRYDEAIALQPNGFTCFLTGLDAYNRGNMLAAIEYLQAGYDMASREGMPFLMLQCRTFLGNCCSNRHDVERMEAHYSVARRLAEALGATEILRSIEYNTAATMVECGRCEEAYAYFSALKDADVMSLHKLAICCEQTGRRYEALAALDRADAMEHAAVELHQARRMCAVVRYRLEHPDYLQHEAYGQMLLDCYEMCRNELPAGYAYFHQPWLIDWYKATRQYKRAFELLAEFS